MNKLPKKLSVEEAAPQLGVSRFTVRRWVKLRQIPFFKIGRRVVFDQKDIDSMLKRSRVEPNE
jgi:excisionase family DNA binding protein